MKTIAVICNERILFDKFIKSFNEPQYGVRYIWIGMKEHIIGRQFNSMIRLYPSSPDLVDKVKKRLKSE